MLLTFTSKAKSKLISVMNQQNCNKILFTLKNGGCNGFEYKFQPTSTISKIDEKIPITKEHHVYICGKSLMFLMGTKIDWVDDMMGSRFIFDNPLAKSSCGCGSSFNPF